MRWTKIDETTRQDHCYLQEADECFHLREYFSRKGYQGGETNQLIFNLKIEPSVIAASSRRGFWKEQAITRCADDLRASITRELIEKVTWVPVPPSRAVVIRITTTASCARSNERLPATTPISESCFASAKAPYPITKQELVSVSRHSAKSWKLINGRLLQDLSAG